MVTVPAPLIEALRDGAYMRLGEWANTIDDAIMLVDRERHLDRIRGPLARMDGARRLLDAIGWQASRPPTAVTVDPREHHPALVDALHTALHVERHELARAATAPQPKRLELAKRVADLTEFTTGVEALSDCYRRG